MSHAGAIQSPIETNQNHDMNHTECLMLPSGAFALRIALL